MADNTEEDQDRKIALLQESTGLSTSVVRQYLEANDWDTDAAATAAFEDQDDEMNETAADAPGPSEPYTGPRTLDGRPATQYATASGRTTSSAKKPAQKRKGIATLGSLGSQDNDHDSDEDDDDDHGRGDLFAGGEKSGLAVQDPNTRERPRNIINDIISKAKANMQNRAEGSQSTPSSFRGNGQTVGGDGTESRIIPGPSDPIEGPADPNTSGRDLQSRTIHIWQDGFSVDDGELRRYDDESNQEDLRMIRSGRAPIHLLNVRYDQPVDVRIVQHPNQQWHPLPKIYRPFVGEGRRLGSPVPGDGNVPPPPPAAASSAGTQAASSGPSVTGLDESQPTITIRVQLPNGTRLPARFNTTQTIGDIYDFVTRADVSTLTRDFVIATTFPNKNHTDRLLVLGDMAEFKRGGTAVVKWT